MNKVSLGSRVQTRREIGKARTTRPVPVVTNWDALRSDLQARVHFGPPKPLAIQQRELSATDSARYWRFIDDIKRYGREESSLKGTPFVGDAFGF